MAQTTTTIKAHVAAILTQAVGDLDASWDTRISAALLRANNLVEAILIGERGHTVAQVAGWDALDDYILDLATYYVFRDASDQAGIDLERIKLWNREKDLRKVSILTEAEVPVETEVVCDGGALEDGTYVPTALDDAAEYVED